MSLHVSLFDWLYARSYRTRIPEDLSNIQCFTASIRGLTELGARRAYPIQVPKGLIQSGCPEGLSNIGARRAYPIQVLESLIQYLHYITLHYITMLWLLLITLIYIYVMCKKTISPLRGYWQVVFLLKGYCSCSYLRSIYN